MNIEKFKKILKKYNCYNKAEEDGKITVEGSLNLSSTNITELPGNLTVRGSLDLSSTNITKLPDNLTVGGSLYLSFANITKLPDNLTVEGSLDLRNTNITELPGNLTVRGSLYLSFANITKLPDNLTVGGSLDLSSTNITELPDNLTVGGSLNLRNTNITELPGNLTVRGSLDLSSTNITELPDNLTVGGSLDLSSTNITELPDNLTVGGSLDLSSTNITELPDNLIVNEKIYGFNGDKTVSVKKLIKGYDKERKYIYFDNILWGNVKSVKRKGSITIYKTPLGYCVEEKGFSAHGKTLKEAIEDLTLKKLQDTDASEIIKKIKKTGKVTRLEYRTITRACRLGTEQFCKQHNIEDLKEIELEELRKILTPENYGANRFWKLIDEE